MAGHKIVVNKFVDCMVAVVVEDFRRDVVGRDSPKTDQEEAAQGGCRLAVVGRSFVVDSQDREMVFVVEGGPAVTRMDSQAPLQRLGLGRV